MPTYTEEQFNSVKRQKAFAWSRVYSLHEQNIVDAPAVIHLVSNVVGQNDKNKLNHPVVLPAHITQQLWEMANRLNETYSCPICYDLTTKDTFHLSPCGHILCKDCLKVLETQSPKPKCPTCRRGI